MSDTGQLREEYAAVYEAAERVVKARGDRGRGRARLTLEGGRLEVARTGADEYEVRQDRLLVFRCRGSGGVRRPDVFVPGEWMVRLMHAGQSARTGGGRDRRS